MGNKYSFYLSQLTGTKIPYCGEGSDMQVNIQLSPVQLLAVPEEGDPGYDPAMAEIARRVNALFGDLATDLLHDKVKAMRKDKVAGWDHLEVTVFLTEKGLLPGFSIALPVKECVDKPRRCTSFFGLRKEGREVTWDYSLPSTVSSTSTSGKAGKTSSSAKAKGRKPSTD